MKLDLAKAFDKVNWMYLKIILLHIGMSIQVVNWIMGVPIFSLVCCAN